MSHTRALRMMSPVIILVVLCYLGFAESAPPPPPSSPRLTLEARVATDSAGCPMAVDLYLVSTADSIQGLQISLRWNRPDYARFAAPPPQPKVRDTTRDTTPDTTLSSLLPKSASTIEVDPSGGLLADWEYVGGRSDDGISAMLVAIPALLTRRAGPILPGSSGLLARLPVIRNFSEDVSDSDSAVVSFDPRNTHASDPNGRLITGIVLREGAVSRPCFREGSSKL